MKIKKNIRNLQNNLQEWLHKFRLWRLGLWKEKSYKDYLEIQYNRTRKKNSYSLLQRTRLLVDKLLETDRFSPTSTNILCIGCRNEAEIEYFKSKGFSNTVGIDLYSENPQIIVMDMHNLQFKNNQFNIIYSSHSLEHSYDLGRVVHEIFKVAKPGAIVAIEVPIHYQVRGADLIDFDGVEGLCKAFYPNIETVIWSEEQEPRTKRNDGGTSIARAIFRLKKDSKQDVGNG